MNQVRITIGEVEVDYKKIDSLPISFEVKTDSLEEIGSPGNVEVDNNAGRIALPGTLNNQRVEELYGGDAVDSSIVLDGAMSFKGLARIVQKEKSNGNLLGYGIELYSGAKALFKDLAGETLRGLEMGDTPYTLEGIEDSFTRTGKDGDVVWAPVYYGDLDDVTNNYDPSTVRPSVFFSTIIEGIRKRLGVRIESKLFDTDFFSRFVYLFGVGDEWSISGAQANSFEVKNNFETNLAPGFFANMSYPNEVTDSGGYWNGNSGVLPSGIWTFKIRMTGVENAKVTFVIGGQYSQVLAFEPGLGNDTIIATVGPIAVNSASFVYVGLDPVDINQSLIVGAGASLAGIREEDPGIGGDVSIASCLHGNKIVDFLSGISHLFNLAWHYDPILKVLTVDPRFSFFVDGESFDGFYKRMKVEVEDWRDRVKGGDMREREGVRPYGDFLELKNKEIDNIWHRSAKNRGAGEVDLMGAKFNFSPSGKEGGTDENPYFSDLVLTGDFGENIKYLPAIVEDADSLSETPEPTYRGVPTYGYYAGDVNNYGLWKWNNVVQFTRPVIFQRPKPNADIPITVSYGDYQSASVPGNRMKGLVSIFYLRWLAMLDRGKRLEVNGDLELHDVRSGADLFRLGKRVVIDGVEKLFIFEKMAGFRPLEKKVGSIVLWEWVALREEDDVKLLHSTQDSFTNGL